MENIETIQVNEAPAAEPTPNQSESGFSHETRISLADAGVAAGDFSREESDRMLAVTGTFRPPSQAQPLAPEGTRAGDMDRSMLPAASNEYMLPAIPRDKFDPGLADQMRLATNALSAARWPANSGSALLEYASQAITEFQKIPEPERELHVVNESSKFQTIFGEKAPEMLSLAGQLIDEMDAKQPGFKNYADETGLTSNAAVLAQIANHAKFLADRYDAIQAEKGKKR